MARRRAKRGAMSVSVDGLERAAKIPGWLEEGQRKQLELAATRLRDSVRKKAPGGPMGTAGRAVRATTLTSSRAVLASVGFDGAKALEKGAYIKSKRGRGTALRFTVGDRTVFVRAPRGVRIPARRYFEKGLRPRKRIIQQTYDEVFTDLEASVG